MERTEIKLTGRVPVAVPPEEEKSLWQRLPWRPLVLCLLSFFCGQALCGFGPEAGRAYAPLGLCLAGACLAREGEFYLALGAGALGLLRVAPETEWLRYALAAGLMLVLRLWLSGRKKQPGLLFGVGATAACLFAGSVLAVRSWDVSLFFYGAEAALGGLMTLVFEKGLGAVLEKRQTPLGPEESLSLLALLAAAALGGANLGVGFFTVPLVVGTYLTLAAGWTGGAGPGTILGVVTGFLLLLTGQGGPEVFCLLAVAGLLAGVLRPLGRWAVLLGLFTGMVLLSLFLTAAGLGVGLPSPSLFAGMGLAGAVFLVLPRRLLLPLFAQEHSPGPGGSLPGELVRERLTECATAFRELAAAMDPSSEPAARREWEQLVDTIGDEVCETCGLARYCWQEAGPTTQSALCRGLAAVRERGFATESDLPQAFLESCAHVPAFLEALNRVARQAAADRRWVSKLTETRALAAEQVSVFAELLQRLGREVTQDWEPLPRLSQDLVDALAERGVAAREAQVCEDGSGRFLATVTTSTPGPAAEAIPQALLALTGRTFTLGSETFLPAEEGYRLSFRQESRYRLSVALAGSPKTGCELSGDSHCVLQTAGGGMVLALSDGMGSGPAAEAESRAAVEFLETFLTAGFPLDLAVRLMNSALFAQSREEGFATLDLCYVDTDTGAAQFVKTGAAACYLMRGKKVRALTGSALPLGLNPQGQVSKEELTLQEGDLLVLLTDGLAEALEKRGEGETMRLLKRFGGKNPRDLADYLMEAARKAGDGDFADDATVLTARLWEKVS